MCAYVMQFAANMSSYMMSGPKGGMKFRLIIFKLMTGKMC